MIRFFKVENKHKNKKKNKKTIISIVNKLPKTL